MVVNTAKSYNGHRMCNWHTEVWFKLKHPIKNVMQKMHMHCRTIYREKLLIWSYPVTIKLYSSKHFFCVNLCDGVLGT